MSTRTQSRLTRILAMLPWAIAHEGATVDEVCARFGYTRDELIDDLNIVFLCGLPGYGPGDLIDAEIDEEEVWVRTADYFAGAPRLSPGETLALLASGMAVIATGQAGPELERAVAKLTRTLFPDEKAALLDVDLAGEPDLVGRLRSAAAENEVVEIVYTALGSGETTTRLVEPWTVFSSLGNWYLQGFCRLAVDQRQFRVDRIRELRATGEHFSAPARLPQPQVRYVPSAEDVRCRIELSPPARWVVEYYPVEIVSDDGETTVIDFSASDPSVAARLLLRLGGSARLLEGDEVREARDRLRANTLALYRD
ncbi:MAG TPA: WYL domain-containing protein [Acidimicrobiia bacterium]|nr:WYL domain-containing protein [Acidimicrobiia bacterium]